MSNYSKELTERYAHYRDHQAMLHDAVREALRVYGVAGKRVLDAGCGPGVHALQLAAMGAARVVGIDRSPHMIAAAQARLTAQPVTNVEFVVGEVEHLPFPDASFDLAFSSFMLQHCVDLRAPFQELSRVLTPGGVVIAIMNTGETSNAGLWNTEVPLQLGERRDVVVHDRIKSDHEVRDAIVNAGFEPPMITHVSDALPLVDPAYSHLNDLTALWATLVIAKKPSP